MKRILLLAAILSGPVLSAQRLPTLDDFLNGERVSGVALSHGGNFVLEHFTVTDGPKTQRHSIVKRLPEGSQVARYDSVRVEWMPRTVYIFLLNNLSAINSGFKCCKVNIKLQSPQICFDKTI